MAGTEILHVVGVHSVSEGRKVPRRRQRFHLNKKFSLAVVTAVRVVCDVARIFEFVRLDRLMPQAHMPRESFSLLAVKRRKTWRQRRYGQRAFAQRLVRCPGQVS